MSNMKNRKFNLVLAFVFVSLLGMAKSKGFTQKVERIGDTLYLVENEERFKVDTEVITVKLKSSEKELGSNYKVINSNRLGFYDIRVPEGIDVEKYVNSLKQTGRFETVEFNGEAKCCFTPNDAYYGLQWHINRIHLDDAWNITKGSQNIKVAIIDSGVDASHSDLGYTVNDGYSQIDTSNGVNYTDVPNAHISPVFFHGTFVAGVLGAKTNNTTGIAGVSVGNHSKGITILPYCVGNSSSFFTAYIDDAILDAVDKGAKVINISISTPYSTNIDAAIEDAYANNVTIVCSSGNNPPYNVNFPASHEKTIAVGATNKSNQRASYSHYGTGLDLVAPGDSIYSTTLNNGYYTYSGTSFAVPQVAGVAALMLSVNPNLTPIQIKNTLTSTCTKLSGYSYTNGWNEEVGYGLLNAYAAVQVVTTHEIVGPKLISTYGQYQINNQLPSGVTVTWSLSDSNYNNYTHLISNSPALGWCLVFRDDDYDMMNATLTAEIKCNNVPIDTLKKTGLYAYEGFKGHYTSGNLSGDISYTMIVHVKSNTNTVITSINLYGATVSYSTTATIPTYWNFNPNSGQLVVNVPYNGTIPAVININDSCGNQYTLYLYAQSSKGINVSYGDGCIIVTVNEDDGSDSGMDFSQPWTVEVRSATTGALMTTQIATSRSSTISTTGWPKGIYIVKVTVDKDVLTEKVIVK